MFLNKEPQDPGYNGDVGCFMDLTLPKAEHLVKYLLSEECENIMYELHEHNRKLVQG